MKFLHRLLFNLDLSLGLSLDDGCYCGLGLGDGCYASSEEVSGSDLEGERVQ